MSYYRFNLEGTSSEAPARASAEIGDGLLKLTISRKSERVVLTMMKDQVADIIRVLTTALDRARTEWSALDNGPYSRTHRRP